MTNLWSRVLTRVDWRPESPREVPVPIRRTVPTVLAESEAALPVAEPLPPGPEELLAAAREEAAAILAAAREEGHLQGLAQGETEGRERVSGVLADLERLAQEVREAQERYWQEVRPELVRLAVAVAGRIVREEIGLRPEILEGILDEALAEARELGRLSLRLHPGDYGTLFEDLHQKIHHGEPLEVRPDAGLSPGDLVVEGENGTVDARISQQLERLERSLGAAL